MLNNVDRGKLLNQKYAILDLWVISAIKESSLTSEHYNNKLCSLLFFIIVLTYASNVQMDKQLILKACITYYHWEVTRK